MFCKLTSFIPTGVMDFDKHTFCVYIWTFDSFPGKTVNCILTLSHLHGG